MDRFWSKVAKTEGGCWVWQGARQREYGSVGFEGKVRRAHRVSYEMAYGPIPDGAHVLHSCDNPPCVNPSHLRPGTRADNMRDRVLHGRDPNANKTHCVDGHLFDAANTYITPDGRRNCRLCRAAARRAYRARCRAEGKRAA